MNDRVEQAGFDGQDGYFTDSDAGSYFNGVDESLISLGHRYYDPGAGRFFNRLQQAAPIVRLCCLPGL